jgi:1,4-alpha-glucan branching enzyme
MDFVLVLHAHLPYVLHHGRWPHGSDWLTEAIVDCYLPLLDEFSTLERQGTVAPVTFSVTPVLGAQLASPDTAPLVREFIAQRLESCDKAEREYVESGDTQLVGVVRWWRDWYRARSAQFDALDGDIIGALRALERGGRIEVMSSAATHGFLPLLARDESIRLQLNAGRDEHRRLFGKPAAGCWLPECAYRPRGSWQPSPTGPYAAMRDGVETFLERAGFRYVVVDAHLAEAGAPLEAYGPAGERRMRAPTGHERRSPYGVYTIGSAPGAVRALVRDPLSTRQVWSRDGGYPGGAAYREFHKLKFPGGLRLWSVTHPQASLGDKTEYDAHAAMSMARGHADHFAHSLIDLAKHAAANDRTIIAPFDAELFGHWWFEGPQFLADVYRALAAAQGGERVRPATAAAHTAATQRDVRPLQLPAGSWGRDGDFSMWLNPQTSWTWDIMWPLEERFWRAVPGALANERAHPVLAQAARELVLAQASDWQFMISVGAVPDYGERRFRLHADATSALVEALEPGGDLDAGLRRADEHRTRDALFPDILRAVAASVDAREPMPAR